LTGRQFILKKQELELKSKELEIKENELLNKEEELNIKEKTFLLKKYKIISDEFLKFNVYPMIGLISILLFKIDKLYGIGLKLIVGLAMFFTFMTIVSYIFILFSKSNAEINEKINGYKNYRLKLFVSFLFVSILSFSVSWYFAIDLQIFLDTISTDIANSIQK